MIDPFPGVVNPGAERAGDGEEDHAGKETLPGGLSAFPGEAAELELILDVAIDRLDTSLQSIEFSQHFRVHRTIQGNGQVAAESEIQGAKKGGISVVNSVRLVDFQDGVKCNSILYSSKESFLSISYEFRGGNVYGLISDFGMGSWAVATCLGGRCAQPDGKVYLNDHLIHCGELKKYSCFISERIYDGINRKRRLLTPRRCIAKALKASGLPYEVEEIKKIFQLSDNRFDRRLDRVSGEIWLISVAVGFAAGKDIFCYPWLNPREIDRFDVVCKFGIVDFLKEQGKIVIVPSSQMRLAEHCDHTIYFPRGDLIYE